MSDSNYHHSPHAHDDPYPHSHPDAHAMAQYGVDRREKEHELYMMTNSGRSHTSDGDGASAIHSVEIHAQYRGFKGIYYNPVIQVFFLGFVCFMCPGLFNALNGLGGGGQFNTSVSANANVALYATFAVSAFFAGCVAARCPSDIYSDAHGPIGPVRSTTCLGPSSPFSWAARATRSTRARICQSAPPTTRLPG